MRRQETSDSLHIELATGGGVAMAKPMELTLPSGRSGTPRKRFPMLMAYIDPKPFTRQSIMEMLEKAFPGNVTIAAASCEELLETRRRVSGYPQFIIVYIRSAGMTDGWVQDELQLVKLRMPDAPVIVFSDREEADEIVKALAFGVRGYIPTSVDRGVAFAALSLIYAGGTYIPAHVLSSASADPLLSLAAGEIDSAAEAERSELLDELDLTNRELAVMHLLRVGNSNKLIANSLKMQESTVKVHVRNILKKLHVANRTQAATIGNRLLSPPAPLQLGLLRPVSGAAEAH
jgi:DNA-binding NarL/FixJ family response regulator